MEEDGSIGCSRPEGIGCLYVPGLFRLAGDTKLLLWSLHSVRWFDLSRDIYLWIGFRPQPAQLCILKCEHTCL